MSNVDSPQTTHIGLCAGYGGIELGLRRAIPTLRSVALCEIEAFACANLVAKMEAGLLDSAPIWTDLKTFPWESFRDRVDILTGGYPCQPFSAAGRRAGEDDPRHLWPFIASGIRLLRPGICFFENVEGHISLGLSNVIEDLVGMGYRTTWGIFSASEVGAPHQRKRVFILAVAHFFGGAAGLSRSLAWDEGVAGVADYGCHQAWPSRPNEPQHAWEPPRVVADSYRIDRSAQAEGREHDAQAGSAGEELGDTGCQRQEERQLPTGRSEQSDQNMADTGIGGCDGRPDGTSGRIWEPGEVSEDVTGCGGEGNGMRQTQPPLGLHSNESSGFLGQALTLNPYGDHVCAYENISKKIRAREVLFSVWREAISKEIQWTAGGLQCFLAEKVLQSGMQLDSFTQRICYFVWCIQTVHKAQGWGLHGMWVYENCRNSSQGQKPIEQFKRELGYAMCQLSYEIALEGRKDAVETEGILQGVREASERAWALSQALPEMEEVWRSSLDQAAWEKGCYVEATSIGNRTDELRLLGNGVVPATAERAFLTLMKELA